MGKKYLITPGQYKALMREGAARTCLECHQCIPKYRGRYPKHCVSCGGNVATPIDDAIESISNGKPVDAVIEGILSRAKGAASRAKAKLKSKVKGATTATRKTISGWNLRSSVPDKLRSTADKIVPKADKAVRTVAQKVGVDADKVGLSKATKAGWSLHKHRKKIAVGAALAAGAYALHRRKRKREKDS